MKFSITCLICPVIFNNVKAYITDIKHTFTSDFIKERYCKHLLASMILIIPLIILLMIVFNLDDTGLIFQLFIGGFISYVINFIREMYYAKYHEAPWSNIDINFGSYGGIIGAAIAVYLVNNFIR